MEGWKPMKNDLYAFNQYLIVFQNTFVHDTDVQLFEAVDQLHLYYESGI